MVDADLGEHSERASTMTRALLDRRRRVRRPVAGAGAARARRRRRRSPGIGAASTAPHGADERRAARSPLDHGRRARRQHDVDAIVDACQPDVIIPSRRASRFRPTPTRRSAADVRRQRARRRPSASRRSARARSAGVRDPVDARRRQRACSTACTIAPRCRSTKTPSSGR